MSRSRLAASVIIPAWNGAADLPACLDALLTQTGVDFEVIVVDNASTDGSADRVASAYPQVRLLRQASNLGFSGGCNAGLAAAQGDVLVLLNQDTEVQGGWLAGLVDALAADPAIAIAGSKALYPDGTIQHAGGVLDAQGNGSHRGRRQPDQGQFDHPDDVDYVTGASLALRRAVYRASGGFDTGFGPAYFEDVDLCLRAKAQGLRVVYAPVSVLVHKEQSVAGAPGQAAIRLFQRNRLRVVAKHWPQARLEQAFLPAERAWMEELGPGGEPLVAAVHEAYLHTLLGLGEFAAWRQQGLGEPPAMIATLAAILTTLHAIYPLGVVSTDFSAAVELSIPPSPSLLAPQQIAALAEQAHLHAQPLGPPRSRLHRWAARFRHYWNRIGTEWYVAPVMHRQTRFNHAVIGALQQMQEGMQQNQAVQAMDRQHLLLQQQRATAVLVEYLAGQAREITALSQEVNELKRRPDPSDRQEQP